MIASMHHSQTSSSDAGFRFVEGWPPSRKKYDGSMRAHVLHKHFTLQRSRTRKKRTSRVESDGDVDDGGQQGHVTLLPRPPIELFQQGSVDPFQSFATPIDGMEGYLMQQCTQTHHITLNWNLTKFIDMQHWWDGIKATTTFQVPRDIFFAVNSSDALTVDVMLAYGATSLAARYEDAALQRTVLARRTKVMRHLQDRIYTETGASPSEGLLIGVGGAIATMTDIEQHSCEGLLQRDVFQVHLRGLRSLIAASWGWNVLKSKFPPVTYLIAWCVPQLNLTSLGCLPLAGSTHKHADWC